MRPLFLGYFIFSIFFIFSPALGMRLSLDDLAIAHIALQKGVWPGQVHVWFTSSGRFLTTFLMCSYGYAAGLFSWLTGVIGFIQIANLVASVAIFIRVWQKAKWKTTFCWAIVFCVFLFFLTPNPDETWFWLAGQISYLNAISLVFYFGALAIVKKHRSLAILSFFMMGVNESLSVLFLIVLFLLVIKNWKFYGPAFLAGILGFMLLYFSVANTVRANAINLEPLTTAQTTMFVAKTYLPFLFFMVKRRFIEWILFFLTSYYFYQHFQIKKIHPRWIGALFLILSMLYLVPAAKVTHNLPPDRSHITFSLLLMLAIFLFSSYLSKINFIENFRAKGKFIVVLTVISLVHLISVSTRYVEKWKQIPAYALAYDSQYESKIQDEGSSLKSHQPKSYPALPSSGMVYPLGGLPGPDYFKLIYDIRFPHSI